MKMSVGGEGALAPCNAEPGWMGWLTDLTGGWHEWTRILMGPGLGLGGGVPEDKVARGVRGGACTFPTMGKTKMAFGGV